MESKRKSKFSTDVLNAVDANGDLISKWCTKGFKDEDALCLVCDKIISCTHHGVAAVKRHANSKVHQEKCKSLRDTTGQIRIRQKNSTLNFGSQSQELTHKDKVTVSELQYAVSLSLEDIPFSSGSNVSKLFPTLFNDSKIARDFSCSRTKLSYMISDGLGPYFKDEIINDIYKSNAFFTLQIDETPIPEKRKQQLDVVVKYFSESQNMIVSDHIDSYHLGSATSDVLLGCIKETLALLPKDKLLCFFSDGPNVMKSLMSKLQKIDSGILDIGKCNLHKVHNAFAYGLNTLSEVETFCIDIYYFFKNSSVSSELLRKTQIELGLPDHVFLRHVQCRWLTLQTSIARIVEQFTAIKTFFTTYKSSRVGGVQFQRITTALHDKTFLSKMLFLKNSAELFSGFIKLFQEEGPLIHVLYKEMENLIRKVLGRFLVPESFNDTNGTDLKKLNIEDGSYWLSKPEIGLDTESEIMTLSDSDKKNVLAARSFYLKCAKKLISTLPLENTILKYSTCLHPLHYSETSSEKHIRILASEMPKVISPSEVSSVVDEWIMLKSETIDPLLTEEQKPDSATEEDDGETNANSSNCSSSRIRVDIHWAKIFKLKSNIGSFKYPLVSKLVKALLCLPHGNADVERGFSANKHILDKRSQLCIHSINGLRNTKSYMKRFKNDVNLLPVNSKIIKCTQQSSQKYRERCEKLKKKRSANEMDNTLAKCNVNFEEQEQDLKEKLKSSQNMLTSAEKLISEGVSSRDFSKVESGQAILNESKKKIDKYLNDLNVLRVKMSSETSKKMKKRKITDFIV